MFFLISLCLFSSYIFQTVLSANILFVSTMSSPSHHLWNRALILGLVEKGHNVTSLTHGSENVPTKNWTVITITGVYEHLSKSFDMKGVASKTVLEAIEMVHEYPRVVCEYDFRSPSLQTLLEYPSNAFDLIVYDTTLGQCMYPLVEKFNNPPLVAMFLLPLLMPRSFGSHIYSSYMPYMSTRYSDEMIFTQRVLNFMYLHFEYFYYHYVAKPREYRLAQKRFGQNIRDFDDVEKNASLVLTNMDPILDYAISLPPNIIPCGGLHIKPAEKLPEHLKIIFDEAEHGVILVSFGTNVVSDSFDANVLLAAFGRLKQTVIWKYSGNDTVKFPSNVVPVSWMPQKDILGHPNLKLFISQCGGFSFQEAIYNGVPLVAIPFLIDQYTIATRLVKRGLAVQLNHWELTADKIYDAVNEVLYNPVYRENMKLASSRFRDQPQTPLERGIFWIEYVLRHGGAEHLVPISRHMPMYILANLDVYLFFVISLVLLYASITFLFVSVKFIGSLVKSTI